jgi:hypothetical protein
MRQRRTALKHVLSGDACKALLVSPLTTVAASGTKAGWSPHSPIPALVSPDVGDLFWPIVRLLNRSGTDSPYRSYTH